MQVLIIGCNGQLGTDMVQQYSNHGHSVTGVDYPDIDITKQEQVDELFRNKKYQLCINCSAFTAVDLCETEKEKAFAINASGVGFLGLAAKKYGCDIVHFSTDYVFDGTKKSPYQEKDPPNPLSVYGKSKLEGEFQLMANTNLFYIFRIAWLYGLNGNNFVKTIRNLAQKNIATNKPLRIVDDQIGTPTYTVDVCKQVMMVSSVKQYGLYHCTNEGACSRYEFAKFILEESDIKVQVDPCSTSEFPRPAKVPSFGVLENSLLKIRGLNRMPFWKDSLKSFIHQLDSQKG